MRSVRGGGGGEARTWRKSFAVCAWKRRRGNADKEEVLRSVRGGRQGNVSRQETVRKTSSIKYALIEFYIVRIMKNKTVNKRTEVRDEALREKSRGR